MAEIVELTHQDVDAIHYWLGQALKIRPQRMNYNDDRSGFGGLVLHYRYPEDMPMTGWEEYARPIREDLEGLGFTVRAIYGGGDLLVLLVATDSVLTAAREAWERDVAPLRK